MYAIQATTDMHEYRLQSVRGARIRDTHQHAPDNRMHHSLGVLPVVNGAHARNHAEEQRQAG